MKGLTQIIGSYSSLFCTRVEWALKVKGVKYLYIEEELRDMSEVLLESSGFDSGPIGPDVPKKVPVLLHGGTAILESLVILEYIDEMWSDENRPSLLPSDPYKRAQARFWAKFLDEKVVLGALEACLAQGEDKDKAVEAAVELLAIVEQQIKGKKFFGGEQIGYLDLVAGWIVLWLGVMEELGGMKLFDPEMLPSLQQWSQSFIEIPLIKETLPPREMLLRHFGKKEFAI